MNNRRQKIVRQILGLLCCMVVAFFLWLYILYQQTDAALASQTIALLQTAPV
ncbi:MAG: hypothetical protein WDA00_04500 [Eubacteriales bacterium]